MLIGANSTMECNNIYKQSKQIFKEANMRLREYNSNNQVFNNQIDPDDRDDETVIKILGITWDTNTDLMSLIFKGLNEDLKTYSKRTILSAVAKIFDPLGLIAPLVLPAKLVIQSLWDANKTWDQKVVDQDQLSNFKASMDNVQRNLGRISMPRYIGKQNQLPENVTWDLLIFTDASNKAYSAVAYLKLSSSQAIITHQPHIIFCKSRLAPCKKKLTIPKMELMGCWSGTKIVAYIMKHAKFQIQNIHMFCDSQIVLHWFYSKKQQPVFVRNRIKQMKDIVEQNKIELHYINTK
jgi:hypothetical protein